MPSMARSEFFVRDAVLENSLQTCVVESLRIAGVAEIVGNQIEASALGRAMAGKIDNHCIFGLDLGWKTSEQLEDVGLGGIFVFQRHDFDAFIVTNLRLLAFLVPRQSLARQPRRISSCNVSLRID